MVSLSQAAENEAILADLPEKDLARLFGEIELLREKIRTRMLPVQVLPEIQAEDGEKYLTVQEVAEYLGVSPTWVDEHFHDLKGIHLASKTIRFRLSDVESFVRRQEAKEPR